MRRVLVWSLVGVLVLVVVVAGVAYWQATSIVAQLQAGPKRAVVRSVVPELHRPPRRTLVTLPKEPAAQTILLIGSDRRWAGGNGARSDTIMLARVEPSRRRIALLSIPRDLYVAIPGHGHDRINMAFRYGGERLLTRVVRDTFGVEIDHFVEIDFHGFNNVVDRLGGVYLPVDQRYYNRNIGTIETNYANIDLQPGYQRLDGQQALAFARYRHGDNDFVRAARQQLLLRIVAHDALAGSWDPFRIRRIARAVAEATTSDISSLGEIYSLARAVHDTAGTKIVHVTLHANDLVLYGADYVAADRTSMVRAVRTLLGARSGRGHVRRKKRTHAAPAPLVADGGLGAELLAHAHDGIRTCSPTALPPGYRWPEPAARAYTLARHPAIALYATAGGGQSILWMYTTWHDPPILDSPSATLTRRGRRYAIYTEHGRVREIAWSIGATRAWITNTLESSLGNAEMIALAESCRG